MFDAPHFQSHDKAREYLEALRWVGEPVCPHCGTVGNHYATKKPGVWRCSSKECRKDFSVTTKTVMESSHIKLNVWLKAFALMTASKKGMSAHQLHRSLGITYKSAWFLAHRIREAMRTGGLTPLGGEGKIVEADEPTTEKLKLRVSGNAKALPRAPNTGITVPSWLLSNAAVRYVHSMSRLRTVQLLARPYWKTSLARASCIPTKAASTTT